MATLLLNQGGPPDGSDAVQLQLGDSRNDAVNVGAGGIGIVATPSSSGLDLRFKSINTSSPGVIITDDSGNNEIDLDLQLNLVDHDSLLNAVGTIAHSDIDLRLPTQDEKDAMGTAPPPSSGNKFVTESGLAGLAVTGGLDLGFPVGVPVFAGVSGTTLQFNSVLGIGAITAALNAGTNAIELSFDPSVVRHQDLDEVTALNLTHAQIDARTPSVNQKSALDASVGPGAGNRYITFNELTDRQVARNAGDGEGFLDDKLSFSTGLSVAVGGSQNVVSVDFGTGAGQVTQGDDSRLPTQHHKDAMVAAATPPTGSNPFVTSLDVVPNTDRQIAVDASDLTPSTLDEKLSHASGLLTSVVVGPSGDQLQVDIDIGTGAGQIAAGDDSRIPAQNLTDALVASLSLPSGSNAFATLADVTAAGGGTTTGQNVGAGAGIFRTKTGPNIELRSIIPASSRVSSVVSVSTNEVEIDVVEGSVNHAALLGAVGTIPHSDIDNWLPNALQKAALDASVSPGPSNRYVTFDDLPPDTITAINVGTSGEGVFKDKNVDQLRFRKLNSVTSAITIELDNPNDKLDFDLIEGQVDHGNLLGVTGTAYNHSQIDDHINSSTLHTQLQTVSAPTDIQVVTAAIGSGTRASRDDHVHGVLTAASSTPLGIGVPGVEGAATTLSRSSHTHQLESPGLPVSSSAGLGNDSGSGTAPARFDHRHSVPTAAPPKGIGAANDEGLASTYARSDHDHLIRETSGATDLTVGQVLDGQFLRRVGTEITSQDVPFLTTSAPVDVDAGPAGVGSSTESAKSDHKHDVLTAAPTQGIGGGNAESVSGAISLALSDHDHALRTTDGGGTDLTIASVADGQFLRRSGTEIVGDAGAGDVFVRVSAIDSVSGHLDDKLVVTSGLAKQTLFPGTDEDLELSLVYGNSAGLPAEGNDPRFTDPRLPIDYTYAETLGINKTTGPNVFITNTTLVTPAATGTYLISMTATLSQDAGPTGFARCRLFNVTTGLIIGSDVLFRRNDLQPPPPPALPTDPTISEQYTFTQQKQITLTGAAETIEIQFSTTDASTTTMIHDSSIVLWRVA